MNVPPRDLAREQALFGLSVDYATAADTLDAALFVNSFTVDGVLEVRPADGTPPRQMRGHEAIAAAIDKLRAFHYTFHLLGQARFTVADDDRAARGIVYCVAHHVGRTAPHDDLVMHIRYLDHYRREPSDAWRFAHRIVEVGFLTRPDVIAVQPASDRPVYR